MNATGNETGAEPSQEMGSDLIDIPFYISLFGLVGNTMTLLTIVRSQMKKNYLNVYLSVLLISDSFLLLNLYLDPLVPLHYINFWSCAFLEYFWNAPQYVSNWTVLALTAERFCAIIFPFRHLKLKRSRLWKVFFASIGVILLFNVNVVYALKQCSPGEAVLLINQYKCDYDHDTPSAYVVFFFPRILFTFLIPTFTVLIVNVAIFIKLRARLIINDPNCSNIARSNNLILCVIPVVYVLMNLPYNLITLLHFFFFRNLPDYVAYQKYYIFFYVPTHIYCANFATNFVLYAMTSRMFRKTFYRLWISPLISSDSSPNDRRTSSMRTDKTETTSTPNMVEVMMTERDTIDTGGSKRCRTNIS